MSFRYHHSPVYLPAYIGNQCPCVILDFFNARTHEHEDRGPNFDCALVIVMMDDGRLKEHPLDDTKIRLDLLQFPNRSEPLP